jgi:LAGLIDADG endonuclease
MKNILSSLNPWFVTGLTDAEGSFYIVISQSKTNLIGWTVKPFFQTGASNNPANLRLLQSLQTFFGGGRIQKDSKNFLCYEVTDLETLLRVRDPFNKFPLQSTKLVNFKMWSQVLDMMVAKQH